MNPQQVIALLVQVVGLVQVLTPPALQAIHDFSKLFDEDRAPTEEDFEMLFARLQSQSNEIQSIV